jgi:hypothetical protein
VRADSINNLQNIRSAYVNIHDFVRVQQFGGDVREIKFPTYKALRNVIRNDPSKRFPLKEAKGIELLEVMLIKL